MPTFTLEQLRTKVYARLDNNSELYTLPEVDAVINECLRTVNLFTTFYRGSVAVAGGSAIDRLVYQTPAGILIPSAVFFAGRQLQKTSLLKLARQRRNWATDTTARSGRVEFWAPVGIGQFVITPRDSVGGREIVVDGVAEPPLLVNPGDVIALENEFVELLTEYGAHRLPLKEGGKVFADGSLALHGFWSKLKQRKRYQSLIMPRYWLLDVKPEPGPEVAA
jgi:hypothetical protein